jgi:hypothetical protein
MASIAVTLGSSGLEENMGNTLAPTNTSTIAMDTARRTEPPGAKSITSRPAIYLRVTHLRYFSSLALGELWHA